MAEKIEIEEIYSKSIRAGRRTYFFDVRSTRAGDYYMTLTESKRDFNDDGTPFYKKHKIYLYKEDFTRFKDALKDVSEFIIKEKGEEIISDKKFVKPIEKKLVEESKENSKEEAEVEPSTDFTEVNFDDLGEE
ncbi:PUR family DNA/RNA-binding protein [Flavobacteriales bacterium]|nr:PUR family DNA/RNA-binding protein [Flavobacteriales bacterium]